MTPEFQKIMFEPFSRADDHRTTKVQGTGLGMAIARNIVNLMNGDIQVESAPNKGTKITVTVYLKLQENEKEQEKELLDLPVLVVDDDKTCCESTVATLQEIGIAGEWVLTGKEAVERCAARHKTGRDYFAVILDWKMPEMDGIATARRIRECVGEDVTIIILTSFDFSEIEEEARAVGVNAFMAKPLFRSRLTATLRQFTSGKKEKNARNYLEDFAKENYAGKRILLVEDNALNREIATEIIGMTGVTIDSAENGKIAVEKVMEAPEKWYDLIFMDIQMPIMNGYEATAAIRALAGSRGKVPIIAMTANAFAEDVQLAKNTGMNEHIAKPLDLSKLNDVLKQWL
jgi:CheY-like chemotaxis protein